MSAIQTGVKQMPSIFNWFVRGSFCFLGLGLSFGVAAPGLAATSIVLPDEYSSQFSVKEIKVSELEAFVNTGKEPPYFSILAGSLSSIAQINGDEESLVQQLQEQLKNPISIDKNNPTSADELSQLVKILLPPNSTEAEQQEAKTLLAQKANNLTLIDFLKKLPGDKLTRDNFLDALRKMSSPTQVGATVGAGITNPVSSIIVSFGGTSVPGQGQFSSVPGAKTIDFESGAPTSGPVIYSAPGIGPTVVSGTIDSVFWAPSDDYTKYLTVAPFGDSRGNNNVSISFAEKIDYFGMYLGSFDSYNSIAVYQDNVLIKLLSGTNSTFNTYVNLFAENNKFFNKIVLASSAPAFESDNHAYRIAEPVPEPTTVLGSLAFGAAISRWRMKRKQQQKSLT